MPYETAPERTETTTKDPKEMDNSIFGLGLLCVASPY